MDLNTRIATFVALGEWIQRDLMQHDALLQKAYFHNRFFTIENIRQSVQSIAAYFLNEKKLRQWLGNYQIQNTGNPKRIGLVMAGNIPLVGFHDLLCVLASGNTAVMKLSSKDRFLLPEITAQLSKIEPQFKERIIYTDFLKQMDAVIATGGNNSSRYFEYYFGKYPHIIRKNRNSIATLTGNETDEDINNLGKDVFQFYGLGCRNVSMLLVPEKYDFNRLLNQWEPYSSLMMEDIYKNNFDYNCTIFLMNKMPHLSTGYLLLRESESLSSPIATLHYKTYRNNEELVGFIRQHKTEIQCVVSSRNIEHSVPFGQSQQPELWDYADGIDTMEFLININ
jgi:hypothetical protein